MTGRIAATLQVIALVGVACVLSAPAAEGAATSARKPAKLGQVTATSAATGAFTVATATATCPAKRKAVSGGYTTSVPSVPNHWLDVYESQRVGQGSWRVSGVEYFPAATDTLAAYVYCEPLKSKVTTASASMPLTGALNGTTSVLALCPPGAKAISGGFATPASNAGDSSYVSRSTVAGLGGWVVDATNLAGTAARTVTGFAYCAKLGKPKQLSEDIAVLGPANSIRTATTPACGKPTTASGGGFATSTPVGGLLATALVYESRRVGASWVSSASASGNSTSSTLVSTALCR